MPPDVYQHDRLQKVLKGLEAEAAAEQLVFDKKKELIESSKGHSRANSSGSAEVDIVPPAKAPDSKSDVKKLKILHSKGLVYADDGEVFAIVWSRIAFFGTIHVLYAVGLIVAFNDWYNGSTTVLKTVLFGKPNQRPVVSRRQQQTGCDDRYNIDFLQQHVFVLAF